MAKVVGIVIIHGAICIILRVIAGYYFYKGGVISKMHANYHLHPQRIKSLWGFVVRVWGKILKPHHFQTSPHPTTHKQNFLKKAKRLKK
jgi:hypothetical protein